MFQKYNLVQSSPFRDKDHTETYLTFLNSLTFTMEHSSPDEFLPFLDVLIHPGPDKSTSVYRKPTHTNLYTKYQPTQQRTELSDLSLEESKTPAPHNTWALNCRPSDPSASSTYKYYHGRSTPPKPHPSQTSTNHPTGSRLLPQRLPTLPLLPLQNLEENSWTARHQSDTLFLHYSTRPPH